MRVVKVVKVVLAISLLIAALAPVVQASDSESDSEGWDVDFILFLWALGLDGDLGAGGETSSVDVGFSDLFKDVDGALMFEIGARKDRIGFYFDPIFAQLSDDVMGPLGGNINSKVDLGIVDAAFTYQLMRNHRFDFLAGLRYYALDVTIELPTGMNGEGDENWVDVIVGVQYRDTFAKKWFYFLRGNIGAGGSEFSWDVLASIGYRFNDLFSLSLGGRALDVDYEEASEGFLFDARMSGVSLNFGFHF